MSMNWRLASRLSVVTLAVLVVLLISVFQLRHSTTPATSSSASAGASGLQGTDLGSTPAPGFSLTDQFGKQVSLSQFKGKPVVLTFMYTNCPDQCPLTANKLHSTMQLLGNASAQVGILAVSTDPKRDNVAAALKFSQEHSMQDYWHYLVGSRNQLSPVWTSYNTYAQVINQQTVSHSLGLFVIDKQGNERVFLDNNFTPAQLAGDLQTLLKE